MKEFRMLLKLIKIIAFLLAGTLVALMVHLGEPATLDWWIGMIPFALWVIGPVIVPPLLVHWLAQRQWFNYVMLIYLMLSAIWVAVIYYDAFFVSQSSTSALVFVAAPIYQWLALVLIVLISAIVIWWTKRRNLQSQG